MKQTNDRRRKKEFPTEALDRLPRAQITFTDESVWVTRFDARGYPTTVYPVALADVAKVFDGVGMSTGLLAPDVLFVQNVRGVPRVGLWLAPAQRSLVFELGRTSATLKLQLPGFVFVGQGTRYWIYAATERPTKPTAQLYRAPLPNVGGDGLICQGSVKFPKCKPGTIRDAAQLFFESAFNSDLSEGKVRAQTHRGEDDPLHLAHGRQVQRHKAINLFQFLKSLSGKKQFPLGQLIPADTLNRVMEAK